MSTFGRSPMRICLHWSVLPWGGWSLSRSSCFPLYRERTCVILDLLGEVNAPWMTASAVTMLCGLVQRSRWELRVYWLADIETWNDFVWMRWKNHWHSFRRWVVWSFSPMRHFGEWKVMVWYGCPGSGDKFQGVIIVYSLTVFLRSLSSALTQIVWEVEVFQ